MIAYADQVPVHRFKKRTRVVIAHNNHDVLHDLEIGLSRSGFSVFAADSGIACVTKLEVFAPEILLVDVDLKWGGCDGVLATVETSKKLSKTRVIVLASDRELSNFQAIRNFTVCDILLLPLPMETITERCIVWSEDCLDAEGKESVQSLKTDRVRQRGGMHL